MILSDFKYVNNSMKKFINSNNLPEPSTIFNIYSVLTRLSIVQKDFFNKIEIDKLSPKKSRIGTFLPEKIPLRSGSTPNYKKCYD